ncbi:Geranylgeranyl pyrophosphate synthase (IspA) (PDB:2AZJ) [Commensalibacter communis]|uniref:Geranylgeranyl pyrophosphate synthase (IspA) n=1 Tax=Commensalibacter communis TaxID=2972786 RepID=A0A9W4XC47_9PROT|nr:polyprenyl synthetase family protein [Commensalibacter communis]CAI3922664.1 Geranylgeranyl pyrophosphate synthase (IspA) (PDB:2AZJ) [Commensalibacter communis]CAI3924015.1 Geranylgeranyl pyrophosphate synthase (IspA) (PDB:2AZJ) [Commensalibacter communis]CAI3924082.1 Geranylgeranyl pyrophosphate synthase (IspA) (PDB:2AZJ) [Commensalibacter communis]CAI3924324.1 Geranylgeranyl pyrophosphate synthase (IspA) (PDB:2AZJ) [Commensalibacter communis]CAI3930627.1 Geranylgeranyl pyrophosphate synth
MDKKEPLQRLLDYLDEDMTLCNRVIMDRMQSSVELVSQLAAHLIVAGGKRLRPLLTLASARLCGYEYSPDDVMPRHVRLATCIEFLHTATLLHDDVVDESLLRRGAESANVVFGNAASVLGGDFLFSRAFQIMTEDGSLEVMRIISQASATIAEGELLQMTIQNDLSTSIVRYYEVIYGKTAALFAASCRVGAIVAERSLKEEEALEAYGLNLGMAFQLVDDALDYSANQEELGKTVGDDFREGKITYPILIAYQQADAEEKKFWERVIEACDQNEDDLKHALFLIHKHQALEATLQEAMNFANKACDAIRFFPEGELHSLFEDIARYTVNRHF